MNIFVLLDDKKKNPHPRTYLERDDSEFKKFNSEGWGVYFAVNEFDGARKTEKVTKLRSIYADFDIAKEGDGQSREAKEEKKKILFGAVMEHCEPTKIIDTSNGLQPLWELEDGEVTEESKKRYVKILKGIVKWSKNYGSAGDNVYDIARILREPGYNHHKEEPYMCELVHESKRTYTLDELEEKFPYEEEKIYVPKKVDMTNLSPVDQAIIDLDFQELIITAFLATGRDASFDKKDRLILDGRLTGGFQGKNGDRQYMASSSHEPFKGNKITAVADIMSITPKESRKWIIDSYNISYTEIVTKQKVKKQIENIEKVDERKIVDKRYSWGTRKLDIHFAIIKPTNFIVIGAKRSSGKTTYSFDMARKNAQLGHKVLYISLEMDTDDILDDFGRKFAGITIEEEFDRKIPEVKLKAYEKKKKEIKQTKGLLTVGIRRNEDIGWPTIEATIDKYENVDMVFVDNLDLIAGQEKEDDWQRQKRIVKSIMAFTSSRQIPVVLIHHYRKSTSGAGKKDHGMDELSGSGKIADGADRIVKISRSGDWDAPFPERNRSTVFLQKGRGYPEYSTDIFFIKGEFVDEPIADLDDIFNTA